MKFCKIAGINPIISNSNSCLLNIQDGVFVPYENTNMHSKFVVPASESTVIKKLCEMEFDDLKDYEISPRMNDSVFKYIIKLRFCSIKYTILGMKGLYINMIN